MLFRAPGTSIVKGSATPINLSEELRKDSLEGFSLASAEMVKNLNLQLNKFKKKIKNKPEQVNIVHTSGYTGGGSIGLFELAIFTLGLLLLNLIRCSSGTTKKQVAR